MIFIPLLKLFAICDANNRWLLLLLLMVMMIPELYGIRCAPSFIQMNHDGSTIFVNNNFMRET